MLLDCPRLLNVCDLAAELLDAAKRGDRAWLVCTLEDLNIHDVSINHNYYIPTYRAAFLRKYPGAEGPLAAFDEVLGRTTRQGADHWLDPENRDDLVKLAEAARALRVALEGKPAASNATPADPWVYGYKTDLCKHLGYSAGYQAKLDEMVELQAITLEPLGDKRKRGRWRMLILKPEMAFKRDPDEP